MSGQIALSVLIRFLIYFVHWMVLAYLPVLMQRYGLNPVQIGTVIGLYSLSSMALMLPMGFFSDFFSPKRTLLAGALLLCLYFASLPFMHTFAQLLIAVSVGGVGSAALIVVSESLYLKLFVQEKRGARIALYQMATYLGFGLGPLAGGMILADGGVAMFQVALLGALSIFACGIFLLDYEPISFSFKEYGRDITRFKPAMLMACIFVLGSHFGVEQSSFSLLLTQNLNFTPREIGLVFAGLGAWMAVSVPFIGRLHDKRESVFLFFLGGLAVSAVFQVLTAWAVGFWSLLTIRLLHTLGDAVAMLELGVLVALFFPAQRLGGNSGLLYGVRTLATFLAAFLAGSFSSKWGYGAAFISNGLFVLAFVAASVLFIMLSKERRLAVGWHNGGAN